MEISEVQALGRILRILKLALDEVECEITDAEFKGYSRNPSKYFAPLILKAQSSNALTQEWDEQLETQMQFLSPDIFEGTDELSNRDIGILQIAYWHYDPEQMTLKEASEFAGVSENAIRDAVKAGKIKGFKMGNRYRLFKGSVEFYKKNKRG